MGRSKSKGMRAADRTQGGQRRGHGGYRSEQQEGGFEKHRSVPSSFGSSFVSGSYAGKKRNEHAGNLELHRTGSLRPFAKTVYGIGPAIKSIAGLHCQSNHLDVTEVLLMAHARICCHPNDSTDCIDL
jgi:hypothetical protein